MKIEIAEDIDLDFQFMSIANNSDEAIDESSEKLESEDSGDINHGIG